ncbi:MAG: ABC transporter permease [Chloroflexales bacterium]|nr:ABC transporter permease [Chloroflexales bacterium]
MFKALIRLGSFFGKELNEVRRQPRLILSLVAGPFLILLLFGAGYQGGQPLVRTALVVPPELSADETRALTETVGLNFNLVSVGSDEQAAINMLNARQVDLVQVLPGDAQERALRGEQSPVTFTYNEINPLNEQWIQYLGYAQVSEINRGLLLQSAQSFQGETKDANTQLGEIKGTLDALLGNLGGADTASTRDSLQRLRQIAGVLAISPLLTNQALGGGNPEQTRQELLQLRDDVDTLDKALADGDVEQQRDRVAAIRDRVAGLQDLTGKISSTPPQVIISPLVQEYTNKHGAPLDLMTYYVPGVVALLIQHIAVTLGALALVRERLLGAYEVFRVAPVSMSQILIGKYAGYTLFIAFIAVVLSLLMYALGVPFLGSLLGTAGIILLLTLASLGVGFLISVLSKTDSQAVQLSMLILLLSIFFSGFFLALDNFWEPVRAVGYALPMTHAIIGLQSLMLRGEWPADIVWIALGGIAGGLFLVVAVMAQIQFRRSVE